MAVCVAVAVGGDDVAPRPTGDIGDSPPHMDAATTAAWDEIVGIALPGVLTNAVRLAMEIAAGLMAQFRAGDMLPASIGHLRGMLGRLGLRPADRAGLNIPQPKPAGNKWAQFAYRHP